MRRLLFVVVLLVAVCVGSFAVPAAGAGSPKVPACSRVAHVGDSTSAYMVPALQKAYAAAGFASSSVSAFGGRSLVEFLSSDPVKRATVPVLVRAADGSVAVEQKSLSGGRLAMWQLRKAGFRGCWVVALGTNDAANIAVGSSWGVVERVAAVMELAQGEPVLWVSAYSRKSSGPWSAANLRAWNAALRVEAKKYPNLTVFDWAAFAGVSNGWLQPDLLHYNAVGSDARAVLVAEAASRLWLGRKGCVVGVAVSVSSAPGPVGCVERRLALFGWLSWSVALDQKFDSSSAGAVKYLQAVAGLPVSGVADLVTLARLGIPKV